MPLYRNTGSEALRRLLDHRHHVLHLALQSRPRPRARAARRHLVRRRRADPLRRGLRRGPPRRRRAARPQGPLQEGARRRDQGFHGHQLPLRGPREPRDHHPHRRALGRGVRRRHRRLARGQGSDPRLLPEIENK